MLGLGNKLYSTVNETQNNFKTRFIRLKSDRKLWFNHNIHHIEGTYLQVQTVKNK